MNKKGALFHWIIFGVLFSIGLFALLSYDAEIASKTKGTWQLHFLQNFYIPAEEKLLQAEQTALEIGKKVILELAENGGFAENSGCGRVNGVQYWNTKETFCFLQMKEEITSAFNTILITQYGADQLYEVSYEEQELVGKSGQSILLEEGNYRYRVQPHFRVNLKYNFDEYFQLQQEAAMLVNNCKRQEDLQGCLKEQMPTHWKFSDCDAPLFKESERKVAFCSESPSKYSVFDNHEVPVRYKFGLDFVTSSFDLPITS